MVDVKAALVVPVMSNFKGFTELIMSVDIPIIPIVYPNWDVNDGVTIAWNAGIQKAFDSGAEYIFVSNDDTLFQPGTMSKMIEVLDSGYDLVSPINTRDAVLEEERRLIPNPDFASFAIKPEAIDKFGWFDENIHSYFNDNDYSVRIRNAEGKYCAITDAGFYHVGSVTQFSGDGVDGRVVSHEQFRAAQAYYLLKWGGMPMSETYPTPFNNPDKTIKEW